MRNRRKNDFGWIWFLFIGVFIVGGSSMIPLIMILAVIAFIAIMAVHDSKEMQEDSRPRPKRSTYRSPRYSSADMARINVFLRHYLESHPSLGLEDQISLMLSGNTYENLSDVDVYRSGSLICGLSEFGRRYPSAYDNIMHQLLDLASRPQENNDDVIDVDAREHQEAKAKPQKKEKKSKQAQDFIDEINGLNEDIPDNEISNALYETASLLTQIQDLEVRFPGSRDKLTKLYEYYLPILIRILHQYADLQTATGDPSYERTKQKLSSTVKLTNEAMRKIISSMTDEDFINLSADMSTLEALLKKDGLTDDGEIKQTGGKNGE